MKLEFAARSDRTHEYQRAFRSLYDHGMDKLKDFDKVYSLELKENRTKTRYKFYFGHVVKTILDSGFFKSLDEDYILTADDVHELLKLQYGSRQIAVSGLPGHIHILQRSTTEMNDSEFITVYEEQIVADYSNRGLEFLSREEYSNQQSLKHRYK